MSPFSQTAALVGVGGLCSLILALFIYTSCIEKLKGAPLTQPPPRANQAVHILFASAALLWIAASALIACPTVPWIYYSATPQSANVLTLFSLNLCYSPTGQSSSPLSCYTIPFTDPFITNQLGGPGLGYLYAPFVASALAIGTCGECGF